MDLIISAATQRTGSTMVQRIFNRRKETLIWGEHGGVLSDFKHIYDSARHFSEASAEERQNYFNNNEDANQWIANMSPEMAYVDKAVEAAVRSFFDKLYEQYRDSHDMIGFKEVRYGEELSLFKRCYPDCRIVLVVRNPVDIWDSMHRSVKTRLMAALKKQTNPWDTLHQLILRWNHNVSYHLQEIENNSNAHLFKYEDIVQKDEKTLKKLSELAKLTRKDIDSVLSVKLLSTSRGIGLKDKLYIRQKCKENMEKLGYY